MRKSIISIFLCFTIFLSTFNFSFADDDNIIINDVEVLNNVSSRFLPGFLATPEVIGAIGTIAVGCGIAISSVDDLYNIVNSVYTDYLGRESELESLFFDNSIISDVTGAVVIGKAFIDACIGTFDKMVNDYKVQNSNLVTSIYGGYPVYNGWYTGYDNKSQYDAIKGLEIVQGQDYSINFAGHKIDIKEDYLTVDGVSIGPIPHWYYYGEKGKLHFRSFSGKVNLCWAYNSSSYYKLLCGCLTVSSNVYLFNSVSSTLPNFGDYNSDNIYDNLKEDDTVGIYIPGDVSDLIGSNSNDVFHNPSYGLTNGVVTVPGVTVPGVGVGDSVSIPSDTVVDTPVNPPVDTPVDTPFDTVRDFIISLVVPSDTFWTDTWNGLYGSFTSSFPGVDMDNFNSLVTGEKKFPNIDINIMGVKGRVVNGDVINSIVDWLRPIIAGFMMLCLMFFNYRKIYKLIRNSEPFGGIAPGTSDFSTGISEYSDNYLKAKEIIGENLRVMTTKGGK